MNEKTALLAERPIEQYQSLANNNGPAIAQMPSTPPPGHRATSNLACSSDEIHVPVEEIPVKEEPGKSAQQLLDEQYAAWEDRRLQVLFLAAAPALLPPMSITLYLPSLNNVISDFNTTEEMVALTISVYTLFLCMFPLLWGASSDRFGRKPIILTSLAISGFACLLCGLSPTIELFIAARGFQAVGMSAGITIGSAVIADVFPPHVRGNALGWFSLTALLGPIIGPFLGGIIGQYLGWRSTFFLIAILATFLWVAILLRLPETLPPSTTKRSLNPLHTLQHLIYPPIIPGALLNGLLSSSMILLLFVFPLEMDRIYGLSQVEIGMAYVPFGIGAWSGSLMGGRTADWAYSKGGSGARVFPSIIAALCVNIGTSGFAWTLGAHFWVCIGFTAVTGFCLTFARPGMVTFAIERKPTSAGGVSAAIFSLQFFCSFVLITFAPPLIAELTLQWFLACIALVALALAVPMAFIGYAFLTPPPTEAASSKH